MKQSVRVFLLWLMVIAAGIWIIQRANITADMSFFLPVKPTAEQQVLVDQLKNGSVSRLLMIAIEGGSAIQRANASAEMLTALQGTKLFLTVQNGAQEALLAERELLLKYRYLLSPTVSADRFSVSGIKQAVEETIDLMTSPAGSLIKPFVLRDPTGELMSLLSTLNAASEPQLQEGIWSSRDGTRALLLLQTKALGSDMDGQEAAIEVVRSAFARVGGNTPEAKLKLQMSGPGLFAVNSRATIQKEVSQLFMLSSLAMLVLMWGVYRSVRLIVFGLIPVVSAVVAGILAVSFAHDTVFAITIGFGTSLVGEAVDYAIYYFMQSSRGGLDEWRKKFWPTVRLGVLTSVFGFGALLFSGFPGLAQLGLHSLAGIVCAALVTRYLLPKVVGEHIKAPLPGRWGVSVANALRCSTFLRWPLMGAAVIGSIYLAVHHDDLWSSNLAALSSVTQSEAESDGRLRSDLGAPDARYIVVVRGAEKELVLQGAEQAAKLLDELVAKNLLGGYDSPTRFLPSERMQRLRQAALPESAALQSTLRIALKDAALSVQRLQPFIQEIEAARKMPLLKREDLDSSALSVAVDSLLTFSSNGWTALLPLRVLEGSAVDLPAREIRAKLAGSPAVFIDMKDEFESLYGQYMSEAQWLSLAGLLCIVALLAWSLRSWLGVLQVMLPLVCAVILVLAGLHLLGYRLHLMHLVGLLLVVAVGSNYSLFFVNAQKTEELDDMAVISLITACLTAVIGFGILMFSSVPVLQALGVTVGPGVILALILAAAWRRRVS